MCAQTEKNIREIVFQNFLEKKVRQLTKKDRRKGQRPFNLHRDYTKKRTLQEIYADA